MSLNVIQIPRRFVRTEWGGTETVILETSKRLIATGHRTEILCPRALATSDSETMDGVAVERRAYFYPYFGLDAERRRQLDLKGGNLFSFSLMKSLKKYEKLDLIHLHTGKRLGGIGRHVALKRGIPYVVSLHGGAVDALGAEAAAWTEPTQGALEWGKLLGWWVGSRRVLDDAGAILCVGRAETEAMRAEFPGKRIEHLPNGVDPQRFSRGDGTRWKRDHDIPDEAFVILVVGRIDPQKNQLLAVEAMQEIVRQNPDAHLVLIGHVTNEEYYGRINDTVRALRLTDAVTLVPGINASSQELVDAYHAANVFALPSRHEPFGIVVLEAWASGRCVVASDVGGIPSLVEHGKDGLLFESDDLDAYTSAILELAESRDRRRAMARAGRMKARAQYSWDVITDRLVEIYEQVIEDAAVPA